MDPTLSSLGGRDGEAAGRSLSESHWGKEPSALADTEKASVDVQHDH